MKIFSFCSAILTFLLSGCTMKERTDHIPAVANFKLPRYMGKWYETARYPHSFERGMSHVSATYSFRSDGKVRVMNRGINGNGKEKISEGIAVTKNSSGSGELRVSFFRPFYGDYKIIYLSPEYDLAIVTSSTKDYLWILSRRQKLSREEKKFCLDQIKSWGFDPEKLIWVSQDQAPAQ